MKLKHSPLVVVALAATLTITAHAESFWDSADGTGNWYTGGKWSNGYPGANQSPGDTYGTITGSSANVTTSGGVQQVTRLVIREGAQLTVSGGSNGIDVQQGSGRILIESGGTVTVTNGSYLVSSDYLAVGTRESNNATGGTSTLNISGSNDDVRVLTNYMGVGTKSGSNNPNDGVVNHSQGSVQVSNELTIGDVASATGTYNLSGTAATAVGPNFGDVNGVFLGGRTAAYGGNNIMEKLTVGKSGVGIFTQTGGAVGLNGAGQSTEIATIIVGENSNTMGAGGTTQQSTWTKSGGSIDANQVFIGKNANSIGTLTNSGGGETRIDVEVIIAEAATSTGTWNNTGAHLATGDLVVGNGGTGNYTNSGTGTTGVQTILAGRLAGSTGSITLNSTTGGAMDMTGDDIIIGESGTGTLTVTSGDLLVNTNSLPRDWQSGDPSILTNGDTPRQQRWMVAGMNAGSTGTINLNGGTTTTGDMVVGRSGTGIMNISGSATFSTDNATSGSGASPIQGDFVVADQNGSSGTVNQTGGTVYIKDDLWIGRNAGSTGTATYLADGGTVHVDNADTSDNFNIAVNVGAGDTLRITSDSNATNSFVVDGHTDVYGTLTGAGHLNSDNATFVTIKSGGNITPDDSVGVLGATPIADFTVSGRFSMETGSVANMQIAQGANVFTVPATLDTASYDQVQGIIGNTGPTFNGLVSITNALAMTTANYQLGMAFDLFNFDNEATIDANGTPSFSLPALPSGLAWYTGVFLTGGTVPKYHWQTGQPGFGLNYNPGTIIIIPEPSTTLLASLAGSLLALRRRRK